MSACVDVAGGGMAGWLRALGILGWWACLAACGHNGVDEEAAHLCDGEADCCPGQTCRAGVCEWKACSGDAQCQGSVCQDSLCAHAPACTVDAECGAARHCQAGACAPNAACGSDADCSSRATCVQGVCTSNPGCMSSAQCPATQECLDGACTRRGGGGCTTDAECPNSQRCDQGGCVRNPGCTQDAQCELTMTCVQGSCTRTASCSQDAQCPATQHCMDGTCSRNNACATDAACPANQQCVDMQCTRGPSCSSDSQCAPSQTCEQGVCTRNNPCSTDAMCLPEERCLEGVCTRNPPCTADAQCPASQSCNNGVCGRNPVCMRDADCPADQRCLEMQCVRNDMCVMDEDCPDTQRCQNSACERLPTCPATACPDGFACVSGACTRNPPCTDSVQCAPGLACLGMECVPFTPGTLACPGAPSGLRILDPVSLTATLSSVTPGAYTFAWSVASLIDSQGNNIPDTVALQNPTSVTVSFNPVVPGDYTLRATLKQPRVVDQVCTVAFPVAGPTADFNAQLIIQDAVDVDLHVMHPVGMATGTRNSQTNPDYFFDFNWGPLEAFTCNNAEGLVTCNALEQARVRPDCHFGNCAACSVVVPGQPNCTPRTLNWTADVAGTLMEPDGTSHSYSFAFADGQTLTTAANPKLDIDNRRGCYLDALGSRVCTPEQVSIPQPGRGVYTVAVHYFGTAYVPGVATSNQRGQPPGATVSFEVELFCRGSATHPTTGGFRRFSCTDIPVDGWCFVADVEWTATGCTTITTPGTRTF